MQQHQAASFSNSLAQSPKVTGSRQQSLVTRHRSHLAVPPLRRGSRGRRRCRVCCGAGGRCPVVCRHTLRRLCARLLLRKERFHPAFRSQRTSRLQAASGQALLTKTTTCKETTALTGRVHSSCACSSSGAGHRAASASAARASGSRTAGAPSCGQPSRLSVAAALERSACSLRRAGRQVWLWVPF